MKAKIVNSLIVGLVVIGTVFLGPMVAADGSGNLMPTLFLGFFAVIIALQVVPALLLFGAMLREIFRRVSGREGEQARSGRKG
ncbi:MAG: hypothetical protein WDA20_01800 [Desulfuromonadales bacterium]